MAVSAEQRRALEMLAGLPHGGSESIMMVHGCAIGVLRDLVGDWLAMAEQRSSAARNTKP